jgi:segregation and condensation protein B
MSETIAETKIAIELKTPVPAGHPLCEMGNIVSSIEAVLFVVGDGVSVEYLSEKFSASEEEIISALEDLRAKYSGASGVHLIKYRKSYQFCTNPAYADKVNEVLNPIREKNLTRAALETMAIVAYKQPITRLEIDEIRGVGSDYAIQILLQSNLIEVVGRKDALGKPLLFGTTDVFLKRFELDDINNLPSYEELLSKIKVIQTNFDLYESNRH